MQMPGTTNQPRGSIDGTAAAGGEDTPVQQDAGATVFGALLNSLGPDAAFNFFGTSASQFSPLDSAVGVTPMDRGQDQANASLEPSNRDEWLLSLRACSSVKLFGVGLAWGWKNGMGRFVGDHARPTQRLAGSSRLRGLFPLPVNFPDGLTWKQQGNADPSICFSIECWLATACTALNWQYGFRGDHSVKRSGKVHCAVLEGLRNKIGRFLAGETPVDFDFNDVVKEVKERRINYVGEEISQPHPLSVEQMVKGLPPIGHGGAIPIIPFLSGRARYLIEHPEECLIPEVDRPPGPTSAKVHIKKGDELKVFKLLEERGVITWLPSSSAYGDCRGVYLNGLFGVEKQGKFTSSGLPVLRCIMNLIPSNGLMTIIQGDISLLPSGAGWLPLVLSPGEELAMSQGDMSSAFYLFSMPSVWYPFFCFNFETTAQAVGRAGTAKVRPCCRVLPMGWSSSVGCMQMISREILLSNGLPRELEFHKGDGAPDWFVQAASSQTPTRAWWQIYLDNFMSGEIRGSSGKEVNLELQLAAMRAWGETGVLTAEDKQVLNLPEVTELGIRIDGSRQLLGASATRMAKTLMASLHTLGSVHWSKKRAQVVLGRWMFVLQFRRAAMGVFSRSWATIEADWPSPAQVGLFKQELMLCCSLAPLLQADLSSQFDSTVTCSDASETGGAAAAAFRLSWSGQSLAARLNDRRSSPLCCDILVISLFNGIGGSFRAYDLLGIKVLGRVSVDICKESNRVTRSTWPDTLELHDIEDLTIDHVHQWANTYGRAREVHTWAGFPCIHLSSVRAFRQNLQGQGSRLFWKLLDLLGMIQTVFSTFCTVKFCIENVSSMDESARRTISEHLGVQPIKLDPSDCMVYNRPRLAWCSVPLYPMEGLELFTEGDYVRAYVTASGPVLSQWIRPGWSWPQEASGVKFPTFMKCIRRQRPPPFPAGVHRASQATLRRWEEHDFMFPPYQFGEQYLLHQANQEPRLLDSSERELLLGYGAGHTATCMSASTAKRSKRAYEDARLTLCGDSFSMVSFTIMAAAMCSELVPRMPPQMIVDRLGLAPGATAHPSLRVPLTRKLAYGGDPTRPTSPVDLVKHLGKSVNHTGSDVRLLTGQPMNKRLVAHASVRAGWWEWQPLFRVQWRIPSHINYLEMKMILLSMLWRCRDPLQVNSRWLHLEDSMVCLLILSKGRTSSQLLQPLCNQIGAVQLAMGSVLLNSHVGSAENPTDAASRK